MAQLSTLAPSGVKRRKSNGVPATGTSSPSGIASSCFPSRSISAASGWPSRAGGRRLHRARTPREAAARAQTALKVLILGDEAQAWSERLDPVDGIAIAVRPVDVAEAMKQALASRPELKVAEAGVARRLDHETRHVERRRQTPLRAHLLQQRGDAGVEFGKDVHG